MIVAAYLQEIISYSLN